MIENKSTDLIAKLLANENISVVMARTSTASFNIETRVLTLPQWKETTPEITGMLVGHEVGHALYTTTEYYEHEIKDRHFQGYLNVLEDVRIEKFMKRRYPGLRKTFTEGYKQLNDKDFFDVKTKDIQDLLLIDRINLYFKAGMACGVTFTRDEKVFIERAERTETIQEVIDLAKDVYAFSKQELEEKREEMKKAKAEEPEEQDGESEDELDDAEQEFGEEDGDEETETETSESASNGSEAEETPIEDGLKSQTESALKDNVEELADNNVEYRYLTLGKFAYDPVITYKQLFADFDIAKDRHPEAMTTDKEVVSQFKSSTSNVVNYLVKEFEMKKAATMYKRAKTSKVGQLDTRKLATYQLKDDIFKSVTTYNAGKNHGMIIVVDWSGSMTNCIKETIEQVINLAMFCARSQIPYQVFAFSDAYRNANRDALVSKLNSEGKSLRDFSGDDELCVNRGHLSMLELFSSKMSSSEMNRMIDLLKCKNLGYFLALNGTPLNECLAYMYNYLPKFQRQFNTEKTTFITLTDGQGNRLEARDSLETYRYEYATNSRIEVKNFLTDPITKKSYKITNDSADQTNAILSMIKDAHGVTSLGFYLTATSYRSLQGAIQAHYGWNRNTNHNMVERLKTEIRANGFASMKGTGRDDLFIVPLTSTKIIDDNFDAIDTKQTAAQIARKFGKVLNTKKTSRILLSKFIDYIA